MDVGTSNVVVGEDTLLTADKALETGDRLSAIKAVWLCKENKRVVENNITVSCGWTLGDSYHFIGKREAELRKIAFDTLHSA